MHRCKSTGRVIVHFSTRDLLVVFALTVSQSGPMIRIDSIGTPTTPHHDFHAESAFAERATASAADFAEVATDQVRSDRTAG